jgi:ADP-ribose pyrophosphatase
MEFEVVKSEIMYRGRAFDVRRDEIRMPDGRTGLIDVVDHSGAITILPVDEQGRVWFVRQYRHPTGGMLLELPAGTLEPDENPDLAAVREIREEIGMTAASLEQLGAFYLAPGYSTEFMYVYLATGLSPAPLAMDDDEFLTVEKIPLAEAYQMIETGEINDAKSIVTLLLARKRL